MKNGNDGYERNEIIVQGKVYNKDELEEQMKREAQKSPVFCVLSNSVARLIEQVAELKKQVDSLARWIEPYDPKE